MRSGFILGSVLFLVLHSVSGQDLLPHPTAVDSLPPLVHLQEAVVQNPPAVPPNHPCQPGSKRYSRLERRVLKVWPYAQYAGLVMDTLETELPHLPDARARKAVIAQRESALKQRFEGELRRLTVREGILLIRLIDRQAHRTTFGVVQELKGRLSAFMWQGLARLFGHDLKSEYDPEGQDAAIEHIIHAHGLENHASLAGIRPSQGR